MKLARTLVEKRKLQCKVSKEMIREYQATMEDMNAPDIDCREESGEKQIPRMLWQPTIEMIQFVSLIVTNVKIWSRASKATWIPNTLAVGSFSVQSLL